MRKNKRKLPTHRVLITGISGFVGSHLAHKLLGDGHEVIGLIRSAQDLKARRLKDMNIISDLHLIYGDITDLDIILSSIQDVQPDWIFHLAAQSYVPQSFRDPVGTFRVNCLGALNLLEAVRLKGLNCRIIFAGSSEEYGLQFIDLHHLNRMKNKYGAIEPMPKSLPELPIDEEGSLRPMSPYATSKIYGDYTFRNYHNTFGLDTIVSRAFNHEGAGRGDNFVTSSIVRQVVTMHLDEANIMKIGDIQIFKDWSHVDDIVDGYLLLAERAEAGSLYVQGSQRCNSVLGYILHTISALGYEIQKIQTIKGEKIIKDPLSKEMISLGELELKSDTADRVLMSNIMLYNQSDEGLIIETNKRKFTVQFDPARFRPSDAPILISNIGKIKKLGFTPKRELLNIINDQINYYLDYNHRNTCLSDQSS